MKTQKKQINPNDLDMKKINATMQEIYKALDGHNIAEIMSMLTMITGEIGCEMGMERDELVERVGATVALAYDKTMDNNLRQGKMEGLQ